MVRCGDVMLIFLEDVLLVAALPIKELSKQTFNEFDCDAVSFRLMIHFSSCVLSSLLEFAVSTNIPGLFKGLS